jgi:hypothetical protein
MTDYTLWYFSGLRPGTTDINTIVGVLEKYVFHAEAIPANQVIALLEGAEPTIEEKHIRRIVKACQRGTAEAPLVTSMRVARAYLKVQTWTEQLRAERPKTGMLQRILGLS